MMFRLSITSATALLSLTSLVTAGPIKKRAPKEVISSDFPDPSILKVDDTWYSFGTQSGGIHVQIAKSSDFSSWSIIDGKDALPSLPSWVNADSPAVWAPDVIQNDNDEFVLYFSASSASTGGHCLGAATSDNIEGPYTAQAEAWVCASEEGGSIDASSFHDSDGTRYVTYKIDGNSLNPGNNSCGNTSPPFSPTPIMQQKVSSNGIDKIGEAYQLLDRSGDDEPLIEAPSIAKLPDGRYVLFFSSGCFFINYDVSYALADSPSGPYTRKGKLFVSGDDLKNPGGASIAEDGTHLLFHAYISDNARGVYATTVTFNGDVATAD